MSCARETLFQGPLECVPTGQNGLLDMCVCVRCFLLLFLVCASSGCRSASQSLTRQTAAGDEPYLTVNQSADLVEIVPAVKQAPDDSPEAPSTAERLWDRIRPTSRISLPRTDFRQDGSDSEVLEPIEDFGAGF